MSLVKFTDVTLFWASLYSKNKQSNKFQVDLSDLNPAQVEKLEDMGLSPRNKGDDKGDFITAKSNYEIRAYDKNGDEITETSVGNGSKATVTFGYYDWKTPAGKKGRSLSIKKLVITDLVPYVKEDTTEQDIEEVL